MPLGEVKGQDLGHPAARRQLEGHGERHAGGARRRHRGLGDQQGEGESDRHHAPDLDWRVISCVLSYRSVSRLYFVFFLSLLLSFTSRNVIMRFVTVAVIIMVVIMIMIVILMLMTPILYDNDNNKVDNSMS